MLTVLLLVALAAFGEGILNPQFYSVTYSPQTPECSGRSFQEPCGLPSYVGRGADLEAGLLYACLYQASAPLQTVYLRDLSPMPQEKSLGLTAQQSAKRLSVRPGA